MSKLFTNVVFIYNKVF